jgi:MerR family redox-sensitive transcriptional activator SoxR
MGQGAWASIQRRVGEVRRRARPALRAPSTSTSACALAAAAMIICAGSPVESVAHSIMPDSVAPQAGFKSSPMRKSVTPTLSIGDVAHQAGVRASRIRYYESIGRRYHPDVLRRLTVIIAAQRIGFTLDEIRELLGPDRRPAHERLRALAIHKLPEIEELIERATTIRQLLITCAGCECDSLNECRILDESIRTLPERHPA